MELRQNAKELTLQNPTTPTVSVIMANYNGADYIAMALRSVLAQSITGLEVLLADDASVDNSVNIARHISSSDPRLKIIETASNAGPAVARNRALEVATGDWVAIVDSDDIIHPQRFERMIDAAKELRTDAIADDLTFFQDEAIQVAGTLLGKYRPHAPCPLTAISFAWSDPDAPQLGYLKPVIRRSALDNLRYREDIRIGEDYDFYMRFLLNGQQMHLLPQSYYLYRRHGNSLSYRVRPEDLAAMIAAQDDLLASYPNLSDELRTQFAARRASLQQPMAFETLVQHIKTRRLGLATQDIARNPSLLGQLGKVAKARLTRSFARPVKSADSGPRDPNKWTLQDWAAISTPKAT